MQSRQLTTSGQVNRQKHHQEQKTYYMPPPPPSTFHRSRPVVPIYSHNNNSYHRDTASKTEKTTTFYPSSRTSSNSSTSSFATLANDTDRSPLPSAKNLPAPPPGVPTSRYIHMLLSIDSIPKIYNLLAAFSTWILLAGYVLLPGTFTSLQNIPTPIDPSDPEYNPNDPPNAVEVWILERVRNTPLLVIAAICSALGVIGMCGLWFRWRRNYVWIINRIFLPGALNSLAGIISTIVNVHTAQQGKYSLTAIVSVTVTAVSAMVNGTLWLVYSNWALKRVQEMHAKEYFGRDPTSKIELGESGGLVEIQNDDMAGGKK